MTKKREIPSAPENRMVNPETIEHRDLNPLSIADTIEANGDEPLGDEAQDALDTLVEAMKPLTDYQRQTVYEVLGDFYCRRCGREQPPGDCQCHD